jgi:hypothetical protein
MSRYGARSPVSDAVTPTQTPSSTAREETLGLWTDGDRDPSPIPVDAAGSDHRGSPTAAASSYLGGRPSSSLPWRRFHRALHVVYPPKAVELVHVAKDIVSRLQRIESGACVPKVWASSSDSRPVVAIVFA